MIPSDAVKHMRAQHDDLRGMMDALERLFTRRPPLDGEARALVSRLAKAMREHNRDEEDYIPPFLEDLGRAGRIHTHELLAQHRAEHSALVLSIEGAFSSGPITAAQVATVQRGLRDLRSHMDQEERQFLNDEVIHDNAVTDGAGG